MDLLRLTTAGSVDDGKSTLIGRLLYDSKSIFEDQLEHVQAASQRRGEAYVNLALLTDGLRAEREQNITIDVAYRYFATPKRKFIIADTPGHVQYTRNMVTGASTAELAIVLIDARNGVLTQSRRHGFLASLLGIPHILVAVNKMDLVDWSENTFEEVRGEYAKFAQKLQMEDLEFIPISALKGDNVVERSENMPWYEGSTLLHHLENVSVDTHRNLVDFRFPVQYVIRPNQDYRGYAGRVASGAVRPGDDVVVLPSGQRTRIASVDAANGAMAEARSGDSVTLTTEDERDISRGDMLVRPMNAPTVAHEIDAIICWMVDSPMREGQEFWLRHTSREVKAYASKLVHRIDVDTLHREDVEELALNDIARVQFTTAQPLFFDRYALNRETGAFILVDPHTNNTAGAGMIRDRVRDVERDLARATRDERSGRLRPASANVVWEQWNVGLEAREARNGHLAAVLWFTGLPGSGKSTIAREVERRLFDLGCQTMLLEGDQLRHGLNGDLGFSASDRKENIRRVAELATLFFRQGSVVVCTFVSPYSEDRDFARSLLPEERFLEIFVDTPLEECERRDPKGLYARARKGEVSNMTGIDSSYQVPENPELRLPTLNTDPSTSAERVIGLVAGRGIVRL